MYKLHALRKRLRERRKAKRASKLQKLIDSGELTFPREYLAGKRVILIGPSVTVNDDLSRFSVDDFDIVVRMNRSSQNQTNANQRTDILYHNLTTRGRRAAGPISVDKLRQESTRYVVYPHADPNIASRKLARTSRLFKRHQSAKLVIPDPQCYSKLRLDLGGNMPTTGAIAIASILESRVGELCVVGLTFFTTGYDPDYNPGVKTYDEAQAWVHNTGLHDANIERCVIDQRLKTAAASGIIVSLGESVKLALQR